MEEELKKQLEHSRTLLKILTYFRVNPFKKEDEKDIQLFNNSVFGFLSELDSKGFNLESLEYFEDWSGNKLCERLIEIEIKKHYQKLGFIKGTPGVLKGVEKEIFKRADEFNALELFIKNNQNNKVNEDFQRVDYSDFKKLLEHKAPKSGKTPIQYYLQNEITRINEYWKDYFYFTPILEQWVTFLKYELEEVNDRLKNAFPTIRKLSNQSNPPHQIDDSQKKVFTFENNFDNEEPINVYGHFKTGLVDKKQK